MVPRRRWSAGQKILFSACVGCVAAPAAQAQTLVVACDDTIPAVGVPIAGTVSFRVHVHRSPASADEATLRFTAYDPDKSGEVSIAIRAPGAAAAVPVGTLDNLNWGGRLNADQRKATYVTTLPSSSLAVGENIIEVRDIDTGSPFTMHRVCIGLEGAEPASPTPPVERFCARLRAPSATDNNGVETFLPLSAGVPATQGVTTDRALSTAPMGFEVVAYTANGGQQSLTLAASGNSQSQTFVGSGADDHYIVATSLMGPSLLLGQGAPAEGIQNTLTVTPSFEDKLWELCLVVPSEEEPGDDAPPDAGTPPPADAGSDEPPAIQEDGGPTEPEDAGVDAGPSGDAGTGPAIDAPDGGAPPSGSSDSGPSDPDGNDDPGGAGPPDDDDGPPALEQPDAGGTPASADPRETDEAPVTSGSVVVAGGCSATAPGVPFTLALALALLLLGRPGRRR